VHEQAAEAGAEAADLDDVVGAHRSPQEPKFTTRMASTMITRKIDCTTPHRGLAADAVRAAAHLEALEAADEADDHGEHGGLADAHQQRPPGQDVRNALGELHQSEVEQPPGDEHPAEHPEDVGEEGEQRQRDQQPHHLRQDEQVHRVDPIVRSASTSSVTCMVPICAV